MRRTTLKLTTGAGYGVGPFGPRVRATRLHPRRDPEGHKKDDAGKTDPPKEDDKDGGKKKPPPGETPEQKAVREAQEKEAQTTALSQWLVAEAQFNAEQARQAGLTDEQRQSEEAFNAAVTTKVEAAKVQLAGEWSGIVAGLQDQLVDAVISGTLATKGLQPKQFETVLGKLDKSAFFGEDGAVNVADVTKFADELAGAATARPPRTGGSRVADDDRGFGRYLPENNN